jgi:peptidylprolyl isomerase
MTRKNVQAHTDQTIKGVAVKHAKKSPKSGRSTQPPQQPKVPLVLSAIVVLLVVLGIAAFMLLNRSGDIPAADPAADPAAAPAATDNGPTATITTPRGEIVIRLLPSIAPQTVENFVTLANDGFYDGLTWHRVIEGFMAQGGDPAGDGSGGPGYTIPAEFTNEIQFDRPGIVAMARRGNDINSAGSQFFITTAPAPHLNSQYTIFGEVIEGQDVVNDIPLRDPMTATEPGEEIISITIEDATESGEAQTQ